MRYWSEMIREQDYNSDNCTEASTLMLGRVSEKACYTKGEEFKCGSGHCGLQASLWTTTN